MAIINGSNNSFGYSSSDTFRSKAKEWRASFVSLKPNTKHDFFINGIDYNWGARQYGKDLGDPLVSDAYGRLNVLYVFEIVYDGGTHILQETRKYDQSVTHDAPAGRPTNYVRSLELLELKAPGSYASVNIPIDIIITPEHTNRIEGHVD